jgi:hypothetical protein
MCKTLASINKNTKIMKEEINDTYQFSEELKDLHRLHLVTKDFKHIIEYEPGSWKMFEPSKFVYAYFAFNTFYNFDWEASVKNNHLNLFPKVLRNEKEEEPSERTKFKAMIDFIFNQTTLEERMEFVHFIKRPNKRENPIPNQTLIECISGITPDKKISESEREKFKKEFIKLIETENLINGKIKNEIVGFIYSVRNNIFHGTKTTIEMSDKNQRKRLDIYSNILIAVNELLFKSLERVLHTNFDRHYKLNLNDRN